MIRNRPYLVLLFSMFSSILLSQNLIKGTFSSAKEAESLNETSMIDKRTGVGNTTDVLGVGDIGFGSAIRVKGCRSFSSSTIVNYDFTLSNNINV